MDTGTRGEPEALPVNAASGDGKELEVVDDDVVKVEGIVETDEALAVEVVIAGDWISLST